MKNVRGVICTANQERSIMKVLLRRAANAVIVAWLSAGLVLAQNGATVSVGGGASSLGSGIPQTSTQFPVLGSVPTGSATGQAIPLSINDAVDRALKQNLGLLLSNDSVNSSKGQVWEQRSRLLPNISGGVTEVAS